MTINNTGSSTYSGIRFDRSAVAKWRVGIMPDDKFQIAKLYNTVADNTFVIDSSGNVGIGTTTPATPLHVKKTGSTSAVQEFLRLENHALGGVGAGSSINFHHYHAGGGPTGGAKAASITAQNMATWPAGTPSSYSTGLTFSTLNGNTFAERMRITSDGDVEVKSGAALKVYRDTNCSLRSIVHGCR